MKKIVLLIAVGLLALGAGGNSITRASAAPIDVSNMLEVDGGGGSDHHPILILLSPTCGAWVYPDGHVTYDGDC